MARGSELGRAARLRRLELGVSQSRVANALGVSPLQVGRWERGDEVPDPTRARALAEALDVGPDIADAWLASANAELLSVEIVDDPLVPSLTVVENGLDSDPSSAPPERRISPPRLDRAALIGRRNGNGNPNGNGSVVAVPPITANVPETSLERVLKRQARSDERRLCREMIAARREERTRTTAETRLRLAEEAVAARRAPLPTPPPGRQPAPAPAGSANTGSVFPVPDAKRGSERVTYQGLGEVPAGHDRFTYNARLIGTILVLVVLTGMLWWAVGSLGDGLGAVLDLFRGGGESMQAPGVAGLILGG